MSFINSSYFSGPITIAQLGQPDVVNNLDYFIARYEDAFLQSVLGYQLWSDLMSGLQQQNIDPRWTDIRDGAEFITKSNFPGYYPMSMYQKWYLKSQRKAKWVGFTRNSTYNPNNAMPNLGGVSPIAGYIYFKYMKDLISQPSGTGIVQNQDTNAVQASPVRKMVDAWNQMIEDLFLLWLFLDKQGTTVYTNYDFTTIDYPNFRPLNIYDL